MNVLMLLAALHVVNVMPAFWHVWDATARQPVAQRVQQFKMQVVMPNLAAYADGEFRRDLASDDAIAAYLRSVAPDEATMRKLSDELPSEVAKLEQSFATALPDFDTRNVVVYFLPSMWHFNGQTHDIGNKIGVLFGIDGIVKYDGSNPNIGVDVAHELFHVYQFQMHPHYNTDNATLWQAMWGEGSAAYASQKLTPGASEQDALGATLAQLNTASIQRAACGIEQNWNSTSDAMGNAYFDAGASPKGLPPRTGYLVGYLVAQRLSAQYSLRDMAKLPLPNVEPLAHTAVDTLCKTGRSA